MDMKTLLRYVPAGILQNTVGHLSAAHPSPSWLFHVKVLPPFWLEDLLSSISLTVTRLPHSSNDESCWRKRAKLFSSLSFFCFTSTERCLQLSRLNELPAFKWPHQPQLLWNTETLSRFFKISNTWSVLFFNCQEVYHWLFSVKEHVVTEE